MHDQNFGREPDERAVVTDSDSTTISPSLIALIVAAILAVVFIVQNQTETSIDFLFWTVTTSVWVAIVVALVLGAVLGWLSWQIIRRRRR